MGTLGGDLGDGEPVRMPERFPIIAGSFAVADGHTPALNLGNAGIGVGGSFVEGLSGEGGQVDALDMTPGGHVVLLVEGALGFVIDGTGAGEVLIGLVGLAQVTHQGVAGFFIGGDEVNEVERFVVIVGGIEEGFCIGARSVGVIEQDVGLSCAPQEVAQPEGGCFDAHPCATMQPAFINGELVVGDVFGVAIGADTLPSRYAGTEEFADGAGIVELCCSDVHRLSNPVRVFASVFTQLYHFRHQWVRICHVMRGTLGSATGYLMRKDGKCS